MPNIGIHTEENGLYSINFSNYPLYFEECTRLSILLDISQHDLDANCKTSNCLEAINDQ
jgi:hypothetical protein